MENYKTNIHLIKRHCCSILLTVVGLFSGYYFIYLTIEKIKSGHKVDFYYEGILISPSLFVVGIYFLIFGTGWNFSIQNLTPSEKKAFYFTLFIGLILGCLALYWVSYNLEMYGYDTSNL